MCPIFVGHVFVGLTMKLFSEKMLISHRCIRGLIPNMIKKSWTVSSVNAPPHPLHPSSTGMKLLGKSFVNQLSGQTDFRFRINDQKQWGLLSKYLDWWKVRFQNDGYFNYPLFFVLIKFQRNNQIKPIFKIQIQYS